MWGAPRISSCSPWICSLGRTTRSREGQVRVRGRQHIFLGPNSPASQETFPDEEEPDFLTTDEGARADDEAGGSQCPNHRQEGGESTPNFGRTAGWTETIDIIPGVTDIEKLMQEPWGDEEPALQETSKGEKDGTGEQDAEKREERDEHRGESKWIMQTRLREGRRTAWSRRDLLGGKIHLPQEEIDKQDRTLQRPFRRRTARATPARLVRDGTPEREAQTTRWAQLWRRGNLHNHPQNRCRGSRCCLRWQRAMCGTRTGRPTSIALLHTPTDGEGLLKDRSRTLHNNHRPRPLPAEHGGQEWTANNEGQGTAVSGESYYHNAQRKFRRNEGHGLVRMAAKPGSGRTGRTGKYARGNATKSSEMDR